MVAFLFIIFLPFILIYFFARLVVEIVVDFVRMLKRPTERS